MSRQPDPTAILQTATAFWPSKVLLFAVGLGAASIAFTGDANRSWTTACDGLYTRK
jgi:hypothetical protein